MPQLEIAAPAALSFEPLTIPQLRQRWLEYHEYVLRSSTHTITRYRTATDHLLRFLESELVKKCSCASAERVVVRYHEGMNPEPYQPLGDDSRPSAPPPKPPPRRRV